jgi:hypothetical protein
MSPLRLAGALILVIVLTTAQGGVGTSAAGGPPDPAGAGRERIELPGADEPHTPPSLNRVMAFRYFLSGAPDPAASLVLVPGLNSGPNTFDILARDLVAASDGRLSVWVVGLRPTLLQDRRGIWEALADRNPDVALAYYYGKFAIRGRTFRLLPRGAAPYAAYWGLDVHLRDVRVVVQEAHRRFPQAPVFLGGHSLGAILAALYAGYDFARVPQPAPVPRVGGIPAPSPGAGARDIRGLVLLDGVPLRIIPRLTDRQYLHGLWIPGAGRVPGVAQITSPDPRKRASPFTETSGLARTQDSILFDVITVYAYLRPEERSPLPFHPRDGLAITNEALLGAVLSDQMQPDLFVRASVGRPLGIFPRIPDPANVNPEGLLDLSRGRPLPGQALIRWPSSQKRHAPPGHVDLEALEEAILRPGGDFTEWYVPWRLVLDVGLAAHLDTSDEFARQFLSVTQTHYMQLPVLIVGAGRGLVRHSGDTLFYRGLIGTPPGEVTVRILPQYTHLDIEDAADNAAVPLIRDWIQSALH